MTEAQSAYLKRLASAAGEEFDPNLSKAEASRRIDELRSRDGSAQSSSSAPRKATGAARRPRSNEEASGDHDRMTDAQAAYLRELVESEGGDEFDPTLSRDAAAQRIAELLIKQMEHSPTGPSRR